MSHDHSWRNIGFRLNPRRNYYEPQTIKEYVFKCDCGEMAVGLKDEEPVILPARVFREPRHFGWTLENGEPAKKFRLGKREQTTLG